MHVTLRTERLVLRLPTEGDGHAIASLCGDFEVARTTSSIPHPYTMEDARDFIAFSLEQAESGGALNLAITRKGGGALVGMVGLILDPAHRRAELGYWVGREHWGRGYASEAARAIVGHAFQRLGVERIFAGYFAGNEASWGVQRKLGFRREGVQRRHVLRFGETHDLVMSALMREDWERARAGSTVEGVWTPTLETERLVLRVHRREDAAECHACWRHEGVASGVLSIAHPLSMEEAGERLRALMLRDSLRQGHVWAVVDRASGRVIGDVGLDDPSERHLRATLGYSLHPGYWNRGLGTEAVGRVVRWAMEERSPGLVRLSADHFPENPASGRVLEKLGFSREGLMRSFLVKDGVHRDVVRWALVRG